ncbi:sigma-70 family RNA polymerase sigma factor [Sphingobacterium sp. UT-1RO-CII-1]|uniref:RNA polymerase sigma factor n=1 Tax=Sphingobacterium sp. UT-1RO-CII-1 TaxID=2995225 RepID=UPI00227BE08E|nr:sigma-70 family RNA polymerase sigma factor [Sphingobacterium sp. UT-1RO-CII-1]MCY4778419.1 sigma-70 family RNA polymerase sigma factor [Sphingobacterium sp. UT-1RO-CII-1]
MKNLSLIKMLNEGNEEALITIFRNYNRPLLYFVMQYVKREEVAEEIVADIFIKVWQLRDNFNNTDNLRSFIYISAKNASLNYLRSSYVKQETVPVDLCEELLYEDEDVLKKIVRTELIARIYADIDKLPQKQREVFVLTYIEDLDAIEISERLGMTLNAVYANRSRAISELKNRFQLSDYLYFYLLMTIWL